MKKVIILLLVFFSLQVHSQTDTTKVSAKKAINKIEDFILANQLDSAKHYISKLKNQTDYVRLLNNIASKKQISYKENSRFILNTTKRKVTDYKDISAYINTNVALPKDDNKIDEDYVELKISQITKLRDDGDLDTSSQINKELDRYISNFDQNDRDVIRMKAFASTHEIIMNLIQKNINKGKEIVNKNLEIAKKFDDKKLEIVSYYMLSEFLIKERKLLEYISVNEKSLKIESQLPKNTEYHYAIVLNLVDAYMHKGNSEKRVEELLSEVYENKETRLYSYSMYAKFITKLPVNSVYKKNIIKKFEVKNTKELVDLFINQTKDVISPNEFLKVISRGSVALEKEGYLSEAISYLKMGMNLTREIYSEKLSKTLADFQTEQAVKIKDLEIEHQKSQNKLYVLTASIVGLLFLITLFILIKFIKQSKILKEKNIIIDKSLKEKELLVKEVHHRVKNNFQIVSSLLELQSKGIEDEKALELANDGKGRVKSMALIHQKLYQNENGLIDFEEYVKSLVKELTVLYASNKKVEVQVDMNNMHFDVDTAIPLGLIINEIFTNSYKYAFNKDEGNELNVSIKKIDKTQDYKLTIADNGPGLDEKINIKEVKSLGLRLITRLVKQLQGSLEQTNKNGAKFEIIFKDITARKEIS